MINCYRGLSYGSASREALRLIARAAQTGSWFDIPEKLIELRTIMQGQMARAVHGTPDEVVRPLPSLRANGRP